MSQYPQPGFIQENQGRSYEGTHGLLIDPSGGVPNKPVAFSELQAATAALQQEINDIEIPTQEQIDNRLLSYHMATHRIYLLSNGTVASNINGVEETIFYVDLGDSLDYAVERLTTQGGNLEEAQRPKIEYVLSDRTGVSGFFLKLSFYGINQYPDDTTEVYITRFGRGDGLVPEFGNLSQSASWGGITGNLTSQVDLKTVLDQKALLLDVNALEITIAAKASQVDLDLLEAEVRGDVGELQTQIEAKASLRHLHEIADVTDLQAELSAKASAQHQHQISGVNGLQAALDSKASELEVSALGLLVSQKADTSAVQSELSQKASLTVVEALGTALNTKASQQHQHEISSINQLQTALDGKAFESQVSALELIVNQKVDTTAMQLALGQKTDTTAMQSALDQKANNAAVQSALDQKADTISVTAVQLALGQKVDSSDTRLSNQRVPTDGSVSDIKIGDRTIDTTITNPASTGSLTALLSWLARQVKSITGKSSWLTAPAVSLETTAQHIASANNPHGVTAEQIGALTSIPWASPGAIGATTPSTVKGSSLQIASSSNTAFLTADLSGDRQVKVPDASGMLSLHPFNAPSTYLFTHFCGSNAGEFAFSNNGTGSSAAFITGAPEGYCRLNCGTAAGGRAAVNSNVSGLRLGQSVGKQVDAFRARGYISQAQSASDYAVVRIGFISSSTGAPTYGVYWEYDRSQSPFWRLVTTDGGTIPTTTVITTALAPDLANAHDCIVLISAGGTQADFQLDGTSVGSITATIPKTPGHEVGAGVSIIRMAGSTVYTCSLDLIGGGSRQSIAV